MDSLHDVQALRVPEPRLPARGRQDVPAVERRLRGRELTSRAQVAIQRAQHHIEASAQRIDRCQVLLFACSGRLQRMSCDDSDSE